jgi:hypothetical protein
LAAVQARLGWQDIDLRVYLSEFFNIKGRDRPTTASGQEQSFEAKLE